MSNKKIIRELVALARCCNHQANILGRLDIRDEADRMRAVGKDYIRVARQLKADEVRLQQQ